MPTPSVLVVEDDETLCQFFTMVLELMPLQGTVCANAEDALRALEQQPADVIVTDLMLPGLDGRGLLRTLAEQPSLRRNARLVVMSGSIDDTVRRELQAMGVWRVLGKPITVKAFRSCIEEALLPEWTPTEQAVIADLFAGQEALFRAFKASSLRQFPMDIEQAERALSSGDPQLLRRTAHNLKSVLKTLGQDQAAELALSLELQAQAMAEHLPAATSGLDPQSRQALEVSWAPLRAAVSRLMSPGA